MYGFEAMTFNIHGGYLEAIMRGYRSGLLTAADYNNLCQCETLDDIKMHLSATEYGPYLQNEPSLLHTTTIVEKCTLKLVDEYKHMLCQATKPLSTFLEYITFVLTTNNMAMFFLICFLNIATLAVVQNMRELYRLVLVDTPLASYFSECITSEVLTSELSDTSELYLSMIIFIVLLLDDRKVEMACLQVPFDSTYCILKPYI
ncbi:V-type proton ATPase subunit d2 [Camellia lanceoleosa]|uniref:V-type proton ATPase subunit d2 n=1 Tax=Camellia lanceoleosa TaxID=1840588 RepID=A0ACC0H336_9ERIC|nr:V-type proton ATPase subunit d2 [Camellia lanceoleosa]